MWGCLFVVVAWLGTSSVAEAQLFRPKKAAAAKAAPAPKKKAPRAAVKRSVKKPLRAKAAVQTDEIEMPEFDAASMGTGKAASRTKVGFAADSSDVDDESPKAKRAKKSAKHDADEDDEDESPKAKRVAKHDDADGDDADDDDADDDDADDDDADDEDDQPRKTKRDVAFADDEDDEDEIDETETLAATTQANAPVRGKKWSVSVGPYVWASSVDANVSLGSAEVSTGIGFGELKKHSRYGAEALLEARYGRWSLAGDLLYGVVAVDAARDVGPLMVTLDGEASSINVDGLAGYTVLNHRYISLEARAGVRYQRTAIHGTVSVAGAVVTPPESVDVALDGLAGGRVFVRPLSWVSASANADVGVVGNSNATWSAGVDANVTIKRRVMLSLGYRTLTMDRTNVSITMHGPRAALQLQF